MRYTTRSLVYIGVFGALWGVAETSLGSLLHVLNVPFTGAFMGGIGITIALIGRHFVPQRGSVLLIGLVTACVKMLSLGGIVLNPMIGIVAEAVLAELMLGLLGRPRRQSFVVAAAIAALWSLIHPFFTQGLLAGEGLVTVYGWTIQRGARLLGLDASAVLLVLALLVGLHLAIGAVAGLLAWDVGRLVEGRLRPSQTA